MPDNLPDGVEALCNVFTLGEMMRLIEGTAQWVAPETFDFLPVWYPEHARGADRYKKNWSEIQPNTSTKNGRSEHRTEANEHARKALLYALDFNSNQSWTCCHIWDTVGDNRFYSCVANMILLPTALKSFTDSVPEVKYMLCICARNLYGLICEHDEYSNIHAWSDSPYYPESWPREYRQRNPLRTRPFTHSVKAAADKRLAEIARDLKSAGSYYPKDTVMKTLEFWSFRLNDEGVLVRANNAPSVRQGR